MGPVTPLQRLTQPVNFTINVGYGASHGGSFQYRFDRLRYPSARDLLKRRLLGFLREDWEKGM